MEKEVQNPDFWEDKEKATELSQKLTNLKKEIENYKLLEEELKELEILSEDESLEKEIEEKLLLFQAKINKEEIKLFLSEEYDKGDAILSISAGAGGQDAQDWATMLFRMYQRYAEQKGFKAKILHQSFGEGGGPEGRIGTKSATLEIRGPFAYGFLKNETGIHRLVRLSPFSSKKLRHTSFASIDVLPKISKAEELKIKIKPEDLRVDLYRASGPGGQNVNKRETAVRITHLSTNITVSCQLERSQNQNRQKALDILHAKLFRLEELKHKKKLSDIKGEGKSVSFGSQIRSYVLHPYKLVKDLRTNIETSGVEGVLDGKLDSFIEAEIKLLKAHD